MGVPTAHAQRARGLRGLPQDPHLQQERLQHQQRLQGPRGRRATVSYYVTHLHTVYMVIYETEGRGEGHHQSDLDGVLLAVSYKIARLKICLL